MTRRVVNSRHGSGGRWHHGSAQGHKHDLHFSSQSSSSWSVEEELKRRRRLAGFDQSYGEVKKTDSESDPDSGETVETDEHEWKQVSDRETQN